MNRPVVLITGPSRAAISGVSTHVNQLLGTALADEYEMVHFQAGSEGRSETAVGRWLRLAMSPFTLFATIVFRHASIVHINTSLVPKAFWRDLVYLLVAKLLRARVLWQVHGGALPQHFFKEGGTGSRFLRWALGVADAVVVLAQVELEAYQRFLPGQYVIAMPNAIDTRPYARVPTVRTSEEHPLRLVYVGRIAREKGLYETLQAIKVAAGHGIDVRLAVAGQGPEQDRLRRYALALGIASQIEWVGGVFGEDKVKLFARSDVFVLPSYSEGLPYALLEAMAAGMPVIATPVGAIPDVMTHGTHGFMVPVRDARALGDAIIAMASHRDQLTWMSRASRRRVRAAYAIERLAAEFAQRYAELCGDVMMPASAAAAPAARAPARKPPAPAGVDGRGP